MHGSQPAQIDRLCAPTEREWGMIESMREIHRPTTDLLTARSETYQVALPPDSRMTTPVDILRQLQPRYCAIHLRAHEGNDLVILQGDNMVVTASPPHAPDYGRAIWECSDW